MTMTDSPLSKKMDSLREKEEKEVGLKRGNMIRDRSWCKKKLTIRDVS